jgi:hypothetical protein
VHAAVKLPESIGSKSLSAFVRRFHGDAVADELRIDSSAVASAILSRATSIIRSRRLKARQDDERWRRNQEKYLAQSRARLVQTENAQYESNGYERGNP